MFCLFMKEGSHIHSFTHGLMVCINFGNTLNIILVDLYKRCANQKMSLASYPDTQDKKWQISKTSKSFNFHCNGQEVLILKFEDFDCGEIASNQNFGWIEFSFTAKDDKFTAQIMPVEFPGNSLNKTLHPLSNSTLPACKV